MKGGTTVEGHSWDTAAARNRYVLPLQESHRGKRFAALRYILLLSVSRICLSAGKSPVFSFE
jgi:hypothetical protein